MKVEFKDILRANEQEIAQNSVRYGQSEWQEQDRKCKVEFFKGASGASYCRSEIICNKSVKRRLERSAGYCFLLFNDARGDAGLKAGKKTFCLKAGEFWMGRVDSGFEGICEYQSSSYAGRCIVLKNDLANKLAAFKNLGEENEICIQTAKINLAQSLILRELLASSEFEGKMREIFMEAKILELIYKSLGAPKTPEADEKKRDFSDEYVKILNKARQILLSDVQNPPSIKELARACATNEFKLKTGFKSYFGDTIYGLLASERLNAAKKLLERGDVCVSEAAKIVGYASAPHFAKIFREKFGVLPTQILKQKKFYT